MQATKQMIEREIRFWFNCLSQWSDMMARTNSNESLADSAEVIKHKLKTLEFYLKEWKEAKK